MDQIRHPFYGCHFCLMKYLYPFLLLFPVFAFAQTVRPSNPDILYTGRIDFEDPERPSYSLNGVSIQANFLGKGISAIFSSSGRSYVYVVIDGDDNPAEREVLEVFGSSEQSFDLASFSEVGEHSIELVKLNESGAKLTFHGFEISDGSLLEKPDRPTLQLEFIGDSNTAGWNAWNAYDTGGDEASGAYHTYPAMVSRMLGAEFSLIGASGSGVTDRASWNCTRVWDRIHLTEPASSTNSWDFEDNYWGFEPDAVVVNLGANDYYASASKQQIKRGWKSFIKDQLRVKYPNAHIVLANSYGWALREPADYVKEAIDELKSEGESNVSFVLFPWLWGQQHAVVNEHAGFANILAQHLADQLNLDAPEHLELSTLVEPGEITNGDFELTTLSGIPDGWRPQGSIELIEAVGEDLEVNHYIQCRNRGLVSFAMQPLIGTELLVTGDIKAQDDLHTGFIKLLFKNQEQTTIGTRQVQPDFTEDWTSFNFSGTVPQGTWSVWLVLESEEGSVVEFDNIEISPDYILSIPLQIERSFKIYPNPASDVLKFEAQNPNMDLAIYSLQGYRLKEFKARENVDISSLKPGVYIIRDTELTVAERFIKY